MERLLHPPTGHGPGLLLIHSWWGLSKGITALGQDLAKAGFVVRMADLHDGQIAATQNEAEALRRRKRKQPMYRDLYDDLAVLRREGGVGANPVGVIGLSMGGHWAIWLAQRAELNIAACVCYYACRGGDFSVSKADYLLHYAEVDAFIKPAAKRNMAAAITCAGRPLESHDYQGTRHWFAESDRPEFAPSAALEALNRSKGFLHQRLTATASS
ncbi:MAG: dienelactone hydrolase family protein [Rhodobacteraceae bacterium]|nr:dienelactone hydrolase family protein [Paracoccaceae bacterium]